MLSCAKIRSAVSHGFIRLEGQLKWGRGACALEEVELQQLPLIVRHSASLCIGTLWRFEDRVQQHSNVFSLSLLPLTFFQNQQACTPTQNKLNKDDDELVRSLTPPRSTRQLPKHPWVVSTLLPWPPSPKLPLQTTGSLRAEALRAAAATPYFSNPVAWIISSLVPTTVRSRVSPPQSPSYLSKEYRGNTTAVMASRPNKIRPIRRVCLETAHDADYPPAVHS